jgi:hypothetical protein
MQKRWVLKDRGDKELVAKLATQLSVESSLAELLVQRGVSTFEEARAFFRPELTHLHDPFLLNDMDKAIQRIEKAFSSHEKVLIYGDYDVDGTTAVALVYTFLKATGFQAIDFYIPDRYSEGYGISYHSIDYAQKEGFPSIAGLKPLKKLPMPVKEELTLSSATITGPVILCLKPLPYWIPRGKILPIRSTNYPDVGWALNSSRLMPRIIRSTLHPSTNISTWLQ